MVSISVSLCLSVVFSFVPLIILVRLGCSSFQTPPLFQGGYTSVSGNPDVTGHHVRTQPAFPAVSEEKVCSLRLYWPDGLTYMSPMTCLDKRILGSFLPSTASYWPRTYIMSFSRVESSFTQHILTCCSVPVAGAGAGVSTEDRAPARPELICWWLVAVGT